MCLCNASSGSGRWAAIALPSLTTHLLCQTSSVFVGLLSSFVFYVILLILFLSLLYLLAFSASPTLVWVSSMCTICLCTSVL